MPRYRYQCEKCEYISTIFHMIDEVIQTDCVTCGADASLNRLLNIPHIKKNNTTTQEQKTGTTTKQFIEDNREILDNQKKETRNKEYVKT